MSLFRHATGYGRGGLKQRISVDPRQLMLKSFLKENAAEGRAIASSYMPQNWLTGYGVGALGNEEYGCCAYAGPAHFINTIRMQNRSGDIITREMVLREYSKWTGFDPSLPGTDNGAYMLDVMKQWAGDDGLFGTRIVGFAEVTGGNDDEVAFACSSLGGIIGAYGLPVSAQGEHECWSDTTSAPWSWGGHCMATLDCSPGRDAFVTWGYRQSATVEWRKKYWSEGYVVLLEEMRGKMFDNPSSGLDFDGLLSAIEQVRKM
jgi:hypothetical protein